MKRTTEFKGEIDNNTIIVGDFDTPTFNNKQKKQKIRKQKIEQYSNWI